VLALLTAAAIVTGAAAVLPITHTAPLQVFAADAPPSTTTTPPSPTTTAATDSDAGNKVWVCRVLVEGNNAPRLAPGLNPQHVAVNSDVARDAMSPDHPSYIVPSNNVVCTVDGKQQPSNG
jgi:hypothetical protein